MPTIYLLRHAQSVANTKGILAGQDYSVVLSKEGEQQARKLVSHLSTLKIQKIYSSPLTRCLQTIEPFMQSNPDIDFKVDERFIEMDYGTWSGRRLSALSRDRNWRLVQKSPSSFTFPKGESFKSMRRRVDKALGDLRGEKETALIISHGDVIKMVLASTLGLPIDRFQNFVVEPASLTVISLNMKSSMVLQTNLKVSAQITQGAGKNQLGGGDSHRNTKRWFSR